jgi:hypothetical protein
MFTGSIPPVLQSFPGVVPGPQNITIPPVLDPQQMMNFMSMFIPQLQQHWTAPTQRIITKHQVPTLASSAVNNLSAHPISCFIPNQHKSPICQGHDGKKQLPLDQHALLNEALPNDNPLSLSSSDDDDDDDDDLDVAIPLPRVHPLRVPTSRTSPYGLNLPGTQTNNGTASFLPFGTGGAVMPTPTSTTGTKVDRHTKHLANDNGRKEQQQKEHQELLTERLTDEQPRHLGQQHFEEQQHSEEERCLKAHSEEQQRFKQQEEQHLEEQRLAKQRMKEEQRLAKQRMQEQQQHMEEQHNNVWRNNNVWKNNNIWKNILVWQNTMKGCNAGKKQSPSRTM